MITCIDYVISALNNLLYSFEYWFIGSNFYVIDLLFLLILTAFMVYIFKRFAK